MTFRDINPIGTVFTKNTNIISFNELQYFKNLIDILGNDDNISIGTFYNCTNLNSVIFPNSIKTIGGYAFSETNIKSDISNLTNIIYIGFFAFSKTKIYGEINFNNYPVQRLGGNSFEYTDIRKINNLGNCKSLTENCFRNCKSLIYANLSNVINIELSSFIYCNMLETVILSKNISEIGDAGFYNCLSLKDIENINNIKYIGWGIFYNCSSLSIGMSLESVTSIGDVAFYNCSIKYLKITTETIPTIGHDSFTNSIFNIYVLDNLVDSYKSATNWNYYSSRIKALSEFIE